LTYDVKQGAVKKFKNLCSNPRRRPLERNSPGTTKTKPANLHNVFMLFVLLMVCQNPVWHNGIRVINYYTTHFNQSYEIDV